MSKLSLSPIIIDDDTWYYEYKKGLEIICDRKDVCDHHPHHVKIPWAKIIESVKRYKKP